MAVYTICSGATAVQYNITIAYQSGANCDEWISGGYHFKSCYQIYRITSDKVLPSDLTIDWATLMDVTSCDFGPYEQEGNCNPVVTGVHEYYQATITAGNTYVDVNFYYYENEHEYPTGPGTKQERYDPYVIDQADVPECSPPPPECALTITGYTATDPTQRGGSDGTIVAGVSGYTGSTIGWYKNNVLETNGSDFTHTFTGLTQGTYYIKALEADCYDNETAYVGEGEFRTGDFVVSSPTAGVVAAENPIIVTLNTATNSFGPAYSVNTFTVTGTITDVVVNFALTFPYTYNAEFRSKGYPDRSSYFLESQLKNQIGTVVGNNTAEEIATSIAEAFQSDPIISRIYFISSSGNTVTMTAKEYSSEYDLSSANVTITGSNLSLSNTVPGIAEYDGQLTSNYSLYTELFVDDTLEYGDTPDLDYFVRVLELELPFSNNNQHQFDLSSTLKNFVSSPKISFTLTGVTFVGDMFCNYFVKYGEKYPLIADSNTKKKRYKGQTGFGWVVNSSLPFESDNDMDLYFGTSGATAYTDMLFFNTAPNTKFSHRDAKEFMSIVVGKDYINPLKVYGSVTLYDGTTYSNIPFFDIKATGTTTNFGGMAVISVGYDDLGLSVYESSSKIRKVDIVVKQYTGTTWVPYSETKSYLLEIDEQPDNFNVAFLNSLGTYETYSFTGELIESSEITRSSYQKPYPIGSKGAASVGFEYNSVIDTEYTKTYTVNTGIIDADTFYFLQGMLQSNRMYRYDDIHQNYLNVIGQTVLKSSNQNEYSLQVQFKETINENNVNQ